MWEPQVPCATDTELIGDVELVISQKLARVHMENVWFFRIRDKNTKMVNKLKKSAQISWTHSHKVPQGTGGSHTEPRLDAT